MELTRLIVKGGVISPGELREIVNMSLNQGLKAISFGSRQDIIFSDGLLAVDVDGASAQPLLELILGGEPPKTVSWTSGKPGRYQMIFQVPRSHWERFSPFILSQASNPVEK